jgi:hypothetical protein
MSSFFSCTLTGTSILPKSFCGYGRRDSTLLNSSLPNANMGKGMEQSKDVEQPQNYEDYYQAVQDRFDGCLHGNEGVDQPQENTHHDENFKKLN